MGKGEVIKYRLKKNNLDNGLYVAKPVDLMVISWENLLKKMQDNTALRMGDMNLALNRFLIELSTALARGETVITPIGIFKPTLRGTIHTATEKFNHKYKYNDHNINVNFKIADEILKYIKENAEVVEITDVRIPVPKITRMKDANSDKKNLSASDTLELIGDDLKFDTEALDEGVFFIDSIGNSFRSSYYSCNTPKKVQARVPEISCGEYHIKIISSQGKKSLTDDVSNSIINII